ncbi:MAG: carboxypeptidase-like regulatory domain-containing protein, partial [Acidobacteria bacterium]|nr:carboxypeptidase-like regulatory domain-containing protein [Acidobacteriota bacterium]
MTHKSMCLVFLVFAFFVTQLFSQSTGSIIGTVADATGLTVQGARVEARSAATSLIMTTTTGVDGSFHFLQVPVGVYDVSASLSGFQTLDRRGVDVLTGRTVDLRLALEVGTMTEHIEVIGLTPPVQTSSAEVQETIDSRAIRELPLNGRNPLQLVILTPGASFTRAATFGTPETGGFGPNNGISINGLQATDNNYRIDGGDFNDTATNAAPDLPNPDSLLEFTVKSSNYSAQYARAGALVQLSTRSGSNELHGSLFEFFRNQKLDARPFFADEKKHFVRNQFGGTVGGPISRDKTFFFGSVQVTRRRGSANVKTLTVATAAERAGDLSGRSRVVVDPLSGGPFLNNQIPSARFSSLTQKLLDLYPLPSGAGNTIVLARQVDRDDEQFLARVDHYFADNHQIDVRWFGSNVDAQRDTNSPTGVFGLPSFDNDLISVNDVYTPSSNLLITTSFSYSKTFTTLAPQTP